jgi:hypothetical protein
MLHLIWTALIGLIVGALAKLIIPGKEPGGLVPWNISGTRDRSLRTRSIRRFSDVAGRSPHPARYLSPDQAQPRDDLAVAAPISNI